MDLIVMKSLMLLAPIVIIIGLVKMLSEDDGGMYGLHSYVVFWLLLSAGTLAFTTFLFMGC